MYDFLDNFFGFGKPLDLVYNTGNTKDMNPAYWSKTDTGYKATCRTVGIAPDDVKVEIGEYNIIVSGKTEYEGVEYNTSYKLPISKEIMGDIKNIDYKTLNGLTYIYLYVETPEKKEIKINKI